MNNSKHRPVNCQPFYIRAKNEPAPKTVVDKSEQARIRKAALDEYDKRQQRDNDGWWD